ncbi:MAG: diadenylate cyclase CdaA [Lachnospiraceae bacterium]|nr:diadenylate cyclase CdaA [Lachnospiraceae bacterium]MDY6333743.1 diadenylate cyclase CdaA [Lachnospiraceae bacterium]
MIQLAAGSIQSFLSNTHWPVMRWTDIVEILIIAFLLYHILLWFKNTRAWALLRGIIVILIFVFVAYIFNMTTILWIVQNVTGIAVIAFVIILQPELRRALEELGQKNLLSSLLPFDSGSRRGSPGLFTDQTINEILRATFAMARVKTGALIVVEQRTPLQQYERTGIDIDGLVTSQLLINIFEKNTPLHDGAVIIRGDRVVSATCYLPLSENKLDKELGTRHRAGLGISEVTDSLTIIVSEETGKVSLAYRGKLTRDVAEAQVRDSLKQLQSKTPAPEERSRGLFGLGRKEDHE